MSKGSWDDKRPGIGERLSSRLSIHTSMQDSLGGIPEFIDADFSNAIGSVNNHLQRVMLGAKFMDWQPDRTALREMVVYASWAMWRERKRPGNISGQLNEKLADIALSDWYLDGKQRSSIGDRTRAKKLGVDYRRYKSAFKRHQQDLVIWMDATTSDGLRKVTKKLRK